MLEEPQFLSRKLMVLEMRIFLNARSRMILEIYNYMVLVSNMVLQAIMIVLKKGIALTVMILSKATFLIH